MYHKQLAYDRDLDPDLRGHVDFDFFGDETDERSSVGSDRNKMQATHKSHDPVDAELNANAPGRHSSASSTSSRGGNKRAVVVRQSPSGSEAGTLSPKSDISQHKTSPFPLPPNNNGSKNYSKASSTISNDGSSSDNKSSASSVSAVSNPASRSSSEERAQSKSRSPSQSPVSSRSQSKSPSRRSRSASSASRASSSSAASSAARNTPPSPRSHQSHSVHSIASSSLSGGGSKPPSKPGSKLSSVASSQASKIKASNPSPLSQQQQHHQKTTFDRHHSPHSDSSSDVTDVSPLSSPDNRSPQIARRSRSINPSETLITFTHNDIQRHLQKSPNGWNQSDPFDDEEEDEDKLDMDVLIRALLELHGKNSAGGPNQENERLLKALLKKPHNGQKLGGSGGKSSSMYVPRRPHHSTINRQKEQRKIEVENQFIYRRLRSIQPTPTMTRKHQLQFYEQQSQYGVPTGMKGSHTAPLKALPITRDPVMHGMGAYSGERRQKPLNSSTTTGLSKSHTHRGMGSTRASVQSPMSGGSQHSAQLAGARKRPASAGVLRSGGGGKVSASSVGERDSHSQQNSRPSSVNKKPLHNSKTAAMGKPQASDSSDISSRVASSRAEWLAGW